MREYKAKEGKHEGENISIWSDAERSRKASIGFGDTEFPGHLDEASLGGGEERRTKWYVENVPGMRK